MLLRYLTAGLVIVLCLATSTPAHSDGIASTTAVSLSPLDPGIAPGSSDPLLSPERRALRQIQDEGRRRVRELSRRLQALGPGPERLALGKEILRLKRHYRQRFLDARTSFDLERESALLPEATASWPLDGVPVCTYSAAQRTPKTAADGSGGVYVTWVDERSGYEIYVQRLTSAGAVYPGWPVDGLRVTPPPPDWQDRPSIAADGAGGALIAWMQRDPILMDWDVYVQRITGSATVATGWPAEGAEVGYYGGDQTDPRVISDGAGGAIVAWWDYRNPGTLSIYAGRVTSSAFVSWFPGGLWVAEDVQGVITPPPICTDGSNGVYVAFQSVAPGNNGDVFVQRLDSSGSVPVGWPSGGENFVPTLQDQRFPDIIADGSGGAVLAWEDYRSGSDFDIYAMRITADSQRHPSWPSTGAAVSDLAGSHQLEPLLVSDGAEGALVTWSDRRHPVHYIFCTRVTGEGNVVWAPGNDGMRLCLDTASQQGHQVCSDGEGGLFAVWQDFRGADPDVYAQHVTADGRYAYSVNEGIPVCTSANLTWKASVINVGPQAAIVAFEDNRNFATSAPDIYAQYITGLINLTPTTTTSGWHSPLVPRNTGDATLTYCPLPATLTGNVLTTNLNWISHQKGPYSAPFFTDHILIDEYPHGWYRDYGDGLDPGAYGQLNVAPNAISGGRHTLHHIMDVNEAVPESNEADNIYSEQYVWSPLVLQREIPVLRDRPPIRGDLVYPNCDGMKFERSPGVAWVTAIAPLDPVDDYDLVVYDDYTGSTSGFSNDIGSSASGVNATDFVVGHFDNTPVTVYPAAVQYDAPAGDVFLADQTDATGRQGSYAGSFQNQLLGLKRLADVYELSLTGGQTYHIVLQRLYGSSDIAFEIFPAASGGVYGRSESVGGTSKVVNAFLDTLAYTPATSGYHPLVVYRQNGTGAAGSEVIYSLIWDTGPVVDVPEGISPGYELAFPGITPNPVMRSGRIHFTLAERGEVRLSVFDLRGRRVGILLAETRDPGPHTLTWDGRGADGRRLGAGIYWLRFETKAGVITRRAVLLN